MRFFDPNDDLLITQRKLPHWAQAGSMVFITWRTEDSIPKHIAEMWRAERNRWLVDHQIDPTQKGWKSHIQELPAEEMMEFHELFTCRWHDELDACHGACHLKISDLRVIVRSSLLHFDGDRYEMHDFVVMPNHVHLMACFPNKEVMISQCDSWKHFTAREINKRIGSRGRFWQQDAFDHLVRHEGQYRRLRDYIAQNPVKARLKSGEYEVWSREAK